MPRSCSFFIRRVMRVSRIVVSSLTYSGQIKVVSGDQTTQIQAPRIAAKAKLSSFADAETANLLSTSRSFFFHVLCVAVLHRQITGINPLAKTQETPGRLFIIDNILYFVKL